LHNNGEFRQSINTGSGRDRVVQLINDFQNHGIASFDTQLGRGSDFYNVNGRGIFVARGASLDIRTNGGQGRDRIVGFMEITVGGAYNWTANGGGGADTIRAAHKIRVISLASDDRPAIDILLAGDGGNDRLTSWLLAPGMDDELIDALIDGGRGRDLCRGNVDSVNCES
jgi:hypothetical protein